MSYQGLWEAHLTQKRDHPNHHAYELQKDQTEILDVL